VLAGAAELRGLERAFAALEREVRASFSPPERAHVRLERHAQARYRGQAHELSVPAAPLATLAERFHRAHERRFGFADRVRPVEVVTLDVRGAAPAPSFLAREGPPRARAPHAPPAMTRVRVGDRDREAAVWRRAALAPGRVVDAPAIVLDEGATFWLPPSWRARVHRSGALLATRGRS
jgi:N-methylhydantoinase A/oxoprolinase/acetone carboxylase beta subunit